MNPISQLCPVTDSQAARLVQDDTMAALGGRHRPLGYGALRRRCAACG